MFGRSRVRFLSGTRIFSLFHARVMLMSSQFHVSFIVLKRLVLVGQSLNILLAFNPYLLSFSVTPEDGLFCLTKIKGNKLTLFIQTVSPPCLSQ